MPEERVCYRGKEFQIDVDDDGTVRVQAQVSARMFARMLYHFPEAMSGAERLRMVIETGLQSRERTITANDLDEMVDPILQRLSELEASLEDADEDT